MCWALFYQPAELLFHQAAKESRAGTMLSGKKLEFQRNKDTRRILIVFFNLNGRKNEFQPIGPVLSKWKKKI